MRKILLIILCILLAFGCAKKPDNTVISSAELLNDINAIKVLNIQMVDEGGNIRQFKSTDVSHIASLVKLVSNLKLKQLSPNEENKLLDEGKALLSPSSYFVSFYDQEEVELKGMIIGFGKDKLIMVDPRTMQGANRSISYLALNADVEKINKLINSIR